MHLASQDRHEDMAGLLLERGADVNWIAKNGLTALHLTAQEDAVAVASVLVKNGAQIDPKTKVGFTLRLAVFDWRNRSGLCGLQVFRLNAAI